MRVRAEDAPEADPVTGGAWATVDIGQALDPEQLVRTCLNCGAPMTDRACKLVCACGYFASCSDYY